MMFFGETRSFLLLFCVIKATGQFLAIQPQSPAYVRTGEKLNLTCQSSQSKGTLAFHDFLRQDTKRTLGTVTYSFQECLKVPTVSDFVRCDFSTSTFILSLLTPVHNQTVFCQAVVSGTASTAVNTTIFVQVPVSDVILSPINTVAVDVGKEFTFRCTARGCRPKANIFWYRNKTLVPETSSNETLDSSLFDVESTLITTFENNETGTMIYCTAINIEGDVPKPSKTALINVKYAPSTEPKLTPINSSVDEGNWVSLRCYLPTLGDPAIIWRWVCGDDDLTMNARNYTTQSTLNFTANRKYDNRACQCWATSPRTSLSYNRSSVAQRITVFYAPLFPPNISAAMSFPVNERQLIILRCTLSSLANPIVLWRWVCGDDNLTKNATNTATESTLTFTADKKYHERKCQCWAMSTHISLAYNKSSDAMVITVFYAPSSPPKLNTDTSVPVHEGQPIMLQCSLSTLANPPVTWRWVCGEENLIPEKLHNDTQSTLNFTANRKYNQKTCQCWATSPIISLSYNQSSKAKIITVYFAVNITRVRFSEGSNNMTAGYPLKIKAEINGNPNSTVIWKTKESNDIVFQETASNVSEFKLEQVTCLHTNDYSITADNGVGKAALDISLNVLCSPYIPSDYDPEPIVVGDEKKFVIQQNYIANPRPKVVWRKNDMSVNDVLQNGTHVTILNFVKGRVNYTTILERINITQIDVGRYNLYLENGLGNFTSVAEVIFKRKPDVPSNISVTCSEPFKAIVSWTAEFDGGGNQSFTIAFSQIDWSFEKIHPVNVSGGRGEYKIVTISDLRPNIEHEFKVNAINTYGNVSTNPVFCKIIDTESDGRLLLISSTAVISSLVFITIIVIAIYWYRRKSFAHNKGSNANSSRSILGEEQETENDDGMRDNILYVSAGPKVDEKPDAAEYAAVKKKAPEGNNNANIYAEVNKKGHINADGVLYSDVKPKRGPFKKDVSKKKDGNPKQKKGKKQKSKQVVADVYENSEDIAMTSKSDNVYSNTGQKVQKKEERGYKNKDGLLYVEVQFDPRTEKGNQTIHGEEEKTDYATVEFPMAASKHDESENEKI